MSRQKSFTVFFIDGELLAVPSGVLEIEGETSVANCTYIFTKANLAKCVIRSILESILLEHNDPRI